MNNSLLVKAFVIPLNRLKFRPLIHIGLSMGD